MKKNDRFEDACLSKIDFSTEICEKILKWSNDSKNFLILIGNPGLGKSYLCHAIKNLQSKKHRTVRMYEETQFFSEIRSVIDRGWDYEREIEKICESDFLIIDDILSVLSDENAKMTDWQKAVLFSAVNRRYNNKLPTVFTCNFDIRQIRSIMGSKFTSRLCDHENTLIEFWDIDRRTGEDYSKEGSRNL